MVPKDPPFNTKSVPTQTDDLLNNRDSVEQTQAEKKEDLFGGKFTTATGLERIRKRLLDLTTNNRLLNYRFPKSKALRVIDTAPDPLFERLYVEGKSVSILYVPDPEREQYEEEDGILRKPDVKKYAEFLGIDTNYELNAHTGIEHASHIRALLYPEDLETLLRKIEYAARTAVEESGTNMLYLVFGFLEWYESLDSDRPMLAPLLILPVSLKRGEVDRESGYFRYSLDYTGDDLTENLTLREKMRQDFSLVLPTLEDNDAPEDYFSKISEFAKPKSRWRLRRQVTLCLLSFGKLLMYLDLDSRRWPVAAPLHKHPLVSALFEGIDHQMEETFAEEYKIDEEPAAAEIPLVFEADSSQHSALIDAMKGKNLVIEGPPGTGKSQTITNLIAAGLSKGKTVLFISEKLAALEVVRRRLDQAHLGAFCLELHSHKTQKKKLLDDIKLRLDRTFVDPRELNNRTAELDEKRRRLNRYAHTINSVSNNSLGLTIHQVLWRAERYRIVLKDKAHILTTLELCDAPQTDAERLSSLEEVIQQLSRHLSAIGNYGPTNSWWGYFPTQLMFGDDDKVRELLRTLADAANDLDFYLADQEDKLKVALPHTQAETEGLHTSLTDKFPACSGDEAFDLLPNIYSPRAIELVRDFKSTAKFVNDKEPELQKHLRDHASITDEDIQYAQSKLEAARKLNQGETPYPVILKRAIGIAEISSDLSEALKYFLAVSEVAAIQVMSTEKELALINAVARVAGTAPLDLLELRRPRWLEPGVYQSIHSAAKQADALKAMRSEMEGLFATSVLPPREEIAIAIRTFLEGGGLFRFFSNRWRSAKRLYRSIRLKKRRLLKAAACARELSDLVKFLDSRAQFENNPDVRRLAGEWFNGIDTDFAKLERIIGWYDFARKELMPFVEPGTNFNVADITELSEYKVEWLASKANVARKHWATIQQAACRFNSLFNNSDKPDGIHWYPTARLNVINDQLSYAAAEMKSIAECFEKLCMSPESPATAVALLVILVEIRRVRPEFGANQEAKYYLGARYEGLETDFVPIQSVIDWCTKIESLGLPAAIKQWLFTPEAKLRGSALQRVTKVLDEKWRKIGSISTEFNHFGKMNWKEWHRNAEITPITIWERAMEAVEALPSLMQWADFSRAVRNATALDLGALCQHALKGEIAQDELLDAFRFCFYNSIARSIMRKNPELMQFSGLTHNQVKERFIELDEEIIKLTGERCAATIARRHVPAGVKHGPIKDYTERALLDHEINKKKRHIPIRQLVRRAGRALQALKPCFMMGPLSVAQYLESGALKFDLVVMDEASQLRPEEALGAIARSNQIVVVGDPKQLPPTSFFDHLTEDVSPDEEDAETAMDGMESILDICQFLFRPVRRLCWHYRSQHHSLIAFSNRHFYKDRPLIVFPSPYGPQYGLGVHYHYIPNAVYNNRRNEEEAIRVADAVITHLREHPDESLGVVTLNISQCELIEEEVDRRLKLYPQAQAYLDRWNRESFPFFIKNLENVQGDERDVIFISTTFGKSPQGVVRNQFGPINRQMGWRRLNVLFTRARRRIEIFTSMQPEDIRTDGSSSLGVRALKNYLTFAKSGELEAPEFTSREPDSDFEIAVAERLNQNGYEVVPQLGVAGFFIDIAVRNPERQGEFIAAVECDGATYHSGLSARDRDRLRQQVLERLGWRGKIYRIWSTDWFKDPRHHTKRLLDFLERAREKQKSDVTASVAKVRPVQWERFGASISQQLSVEPEILSGSADPDKLIVEIWDYVTYCDLERPDDHKSVQIVQGHTDAEKGVVGENAPLAKALIGAEVGDKVELNVPGKPKRRLQVLKIER